MYEDVLVPTDGAPGMAGVVARGVALGELFDVTVHGPAVTDTRVEPDGMSDTDQRAWRAAAADLETTPAVREGTPYQVVLDYVTEYDADIAVMGTDSREETYPLQLRSTTARVVTLDDVPALATPPADDPATGAR